MDLEFVVDVEFFTEPDEAFGLGDLEVVDCESHGGGWDGGRGEVGC